MNRIKILKVLKAVIFTVEVILALFLAAVIVFGVFYTIKDSPEVLKGISSPNFYESFREFLANIFLLIVGVELIRMLVTHTMRSTLELMVFVIARKMLIYTESMMDIILGTVALGLIFGIIKYLIPNKFDRTSPIDLFPAGMKLSEFNRLSNYDIPVQDTNITIEDFILGSVSEGQCVTKGYEADAGTVKLKVASMKNGRITFIQVLDSEFMD